MKTKNNLIGICGIILLVAVFVVDVKYLGGYFVDLSDYISMLLLIILFFGSLYVGNQLKFFCSAVKISFSKNPELPEKATIKKMEYAVDYAIKTLIYSGVLFALLGIFIMLHSLLQPADVGPLTAIALISVIWPMLLVLFIHQIKGRVHSLLK